MKVANLVKAYVEKYKHIRKHKKDWCWRRASWLNQEMRSSRGRRRKASPDDNVFLPFEGGRNTPLHVAIPSHPHPGNWMQKTFLQLGTLSHRSLPFLELIADEEPLGSLTSEETLRKGCVRACVWWGWPNYLSWFYFSLSFVFFNFCTTHQSLTQTLLYPAYDSVCSSHCCSYLWKIQILLWFSIGFILEPWYFFPLSYERNIGLVQSNGTCRCMLTFINFFWKSCHGDGDYLHSVNNVVMKNFIWVSGTAWQWTELCHAPCE